MEENGKCSYACVCLEYSLTLDMSCDVSAAKLVGPRPLNGVVKHLHRAHDGLFPPTNGLGWAVAEE
jgi:hypothetical protein